MANEIRITLPIGRLVQGSLYKARDKDADGNPLLIKNGPNKGQPRVDFYIAIAIPKNPGETHWSQSPWGQQILAVGAAAFPQQYQAPTFAWKVEDGDSQIPNTRGKKPCDSEGFRGHWIVKLGGGYAPRVYRQTGPGTFAQLTDDGAVKLGYYVSAQISVESNSSTQRPGVYLNHGMILFAGTGPEIVVGPDAAEVFGGVSTGALPAGAVPLGAAVGLPGAPMGVPGLPAALPAPVAPALPVGAPVLAAPAPVVVAPHVGFVAPAVPGLPAAVAPVLVAPAVPMAPAAPPAAPVRQMTAAANGVPYQAYIDKGWTDATLVQHGLMVA